MNGGGVISILSLVLVILALAFCKRKDRTGVVLMNNTNIPKENITQGALHAWRIEGGVYVVRPFVVSTEPEVAVTFVNSGTFQTYQSAVQTSTLVLNQSDVLAMDNARVEKLEYTASDKPVENWRISKRNTNNKLSVPDFSSPTSSAYFAYFEKTANTTKFSITSYAVSNPLGSARLLGLPGDPFVVFYTDKGANKVAGGYMDKTDGGVYFTVNELLSVQAVDIKYVLGTLGVMQMEGLAPEINNIKPCDNPVVAKYFAKYVNAGKNIEVQLTDADFESLAGNPASGNLLVSGSTEGGYPYEQTVVASNPFVISATPQDLQGNISGVYAANPISQIKGVKGCVNTAPNDATNPILPEGSSNLLPDLKEVKFMQGALELKHQVNGTNILVEAYENKGAIQMVLAKAGKCNVIYFQNKPNAEVALQQPSDCNVETLWAGVSNVGSNTGYAFPGLQADVAKLIAEVKDLNKNRATYQIDIDVLNTSESLDYMIAEQKDGVYTNGKLSGNADFSAKKIFVRGVNKRLFDKTAPQNPGASVPVKVTLRTEADNIKFDNGQVNKNSAREFTVDITDDILNSGTRNVLELWANGSAGKTIYTFEFDYQSSNADLEDSVVVEQTDKSDANVGENTRLATTLNGTVLEIGNVFQFLNAKASPVLLKTAQTVDANATYKVVNNADAVQASQQLWIGGTAGQPITGGTVNKIRVTAEDGTTKDYTVQIKNALSVEAVLTEVKDQAILPICAGVCANINPVAQLVAGNKINITHLSSKAEKYLLNTSVPLNFAYSDKAQIQVSADGTSFINPADLTAIAFIDFSQVDENIVKNIRVLSEDARVHADYLLENTYLATENRIAKITFAQRNAGADIKRYTFWNNTIAGATAPTAGTTPEDITAFAGVEFKFNVLVGGEIYVKSITLVDGTTASVTNAGAEQTQVIMNNPQVGALNFVTGKDKIHVQAEDPAVSALAYSIIIDDVQNTEARLTAYAFESYKSPKESTIYTIPTYTTGTSAYTLTAPAGKIRSEGHTVQNFDFSTGAKYKVYCENETGVLDNTNVCFANFAPYNELQEIISKDHKKRVKKIVITAEAGSILGEENTYTINYGAYKDTNRILTAIQFTQTYQDAVGATQTPTFSLAGNNLQIDHTAGVIAFNSSIVAKGKLELNIAGDITSNSINAMPYGTPAPTFPWVLETDLSKKLTELPTTIKVVSEDDDVRVYVIKPTYLSSDVALTKFFVLQNGKPSLNQATENSGNPDKEIKPFQVGVAPGVVTLKVLIGQDAVISEKTLEINTLKAENYKGKVYYTASLGLFDADDANTYTLLVDGTGVFQSVTIPAISDETQKSNFGLVIFSEDGTKAASYNVAISYEAPVEVRIADFKVRYNTAAGVEASASVDNANKEITIYQNIDPDNTEASKKIFFSSIAYEAGFEALNFNGDKTNCCSMVYFKDTYYSQINPLTFAATAIALGNKTPTPEILPIKNRRGEEVPYTLKYKNEWTTLVDLELEQQCNATGREKIKLSTQEGNIVVTNTKEPDGSLTGVIKLYGIVRPARGTDCGKFKVLSINYTPDVNSAPQVNDDIFQLTETQVLVTDPVKAELDNAITLRTPSAMQRVYKIEVVEETAGRYGFLNWDASLQKIQFVQKISGVTGKPTLNNALLGETIGTAYGFAQLGYKTYYPENAIVSNGLEQTMSVKDVLFNPTLATNINATNGANALCLKSKPQVAREATIQLITDQTGASVQVDFLADNTPYTATANDICWSGALKPLVTPSEQLEYKVTFQTESEDGYDKVKYPVTFTPIKDIVIENVKVEQGVGSNAKAMVVVDNTPGNRKIRIQPTVAYTTSTFGGSPAIAMGSNPMTLKDIVLSNVCEDCTIRIPRGVILDNAVTLPSNGDFAIKNNINLLVDKKMSVLDAGNEKITYISNEGNPTLLNGAKITLTNNKTYQSVVYQVEVENLITSIEFDKLNTNPMAQLQSYKDELYDGKIRAGHFYQLRQVTPRITSMSADVVQLRFVTTTAQRDIIETKKGGIEYVFVSKNGKDVGTAIKIPSGNVLAGKEFYGFSAIFSTWFKDIQDDASKYKLLFRYVTTKEKLLEFSPYEVYSSFDFAGMMYLKHGIGTTADKTLNPVYELQRDIDFETEGMGANYMSIGEESAYYNNGTVANANGFTWGATLASAPYFNGTFNGNGHSIAIQVNAAINHLSNKGNTHNALNYLTGHINQDGSGTINGAGTNQISLGLFARLGRKAVLKDFTLKVKDAEAAISYGYGNPPSSAFYAHGAGILVGNLVPFGASTTPNLEETMTALERIKLETQNIKITSYAPNYSNFGALVGRAYNTGLSMVDCAVNIKNVQHGAVLQTIAPQYYWNDMLNARNGFGGMLGVAVWNDNATNVNGLQNINNINLVRQKPYYVDIKNSSVNITEYNTAHLARFMLFGAVVAHTGFHTYLDNVQTSIGKISLKPTSVATNMDATKSMSAIVGGHIGEAIGYDVMGVSLPRNIELSIKNSSANIGTVQDDIFNITDNTLTVSSLVGGSIGYIYHLGNVTLDKVSTQIGKAIVAQGRTLTTAAPNRYAHIADVASRRMATGGVSGLVGLVQKLDYSALYSSAELNINDAKVSLGEMQNVPSVAGVLLQANQPNQGATGALNWLRIQNSDVSFTAPISAINFFGAAGPATIFANVVLNNVSVETKAPVSIGPDNQTGDYTSLANTFSGLLDLSAYTNINTNLKPSGATPNDVESQITISKPTVIIKEIIVDTKNLFGTFAPGKGLGGKVVEGSVVVGGLANYAGVITCTTCRKLLITVDDPQIDIQSFNYQYNSSTQGFIGYQTYAYWFELGGLIGYGKQKAKLTVNGGSVKVNADKVRIYTEFDNRADYSTIAHHLYSRDISLGGVIGRAGYASANTFETYTIKDVQVTLNTDIRQNQPYYMPYINGKVSDYKPITGSASTGMTLSPKGVRCVYWRVSSGNIGGAWNMLPSTSNIPGDNYAYVEDMTNPVSLYGWLYYTMSPLQRNRIGMVIPAGKMCPPNRNNNPNGTCPGCINYNAYGGFQLQMETDPVARFNNVASQLSIRGYSALHGPAGTYGVIAGPPAPGYLAYGWLDGYGRDASQKFWGGTLQAGGHSYQYQLLSSPRRNGFKVFGEQRNLVGGIIGFTSSGGMQMALNNNTISGTVNIKTYEPSMGEFEVNGVKVNMTAEGADKFGTAFIFPVLAHERTGQATGYRISGYYMMHNPFIAVGGLAGLFEAGTIGGSANSVGGLAVNNDYVGFNMQYVVRGNTNFDALTQKTLAQQKILPFNNFFSSPLTKPLADLNNANFVTNPSVSGGFRVNESSFMDLSTEHYRLDRLYKTSPADLKLVGGEFAPYNASDKPEDYSTLYVEGNVENMDIVYDQFAKNNLLTAGRFEAMTLDNSTGTTGTAGKVKRVQDLLVVGMQARPTLVGNNWALFKGTSFTSIVTGKVQIANKDMVYPAKGAFTGVTATGSTGSGVLPNITTDGTGKYYWFNPTVTAAGVTAGTWFMLTDKPE